MSASPNPIVVVVAAALLSAPVAAFQHSSMPPGMTHAEHLVQLKKDADLKKRGAVAMGFDQDKTTHHFLLTRAGGAILVDANSADDGETRDAVRTHLAEIAGEFARGVFDKPFATHAETPPGVPAMTRLKASIAYRFESTERGGRVAIVSSEPAAIEAIHQFLRYQIQEHGTGTKTSN